MGMTVNFHTHSGAEARALQVGDVYWVHLDGEEGRCTVSVFMPSMEHAQAVANAFNNAFTIKQDADNTVCAACGGDKRLRNPTGHCDHLHWPDNLTPEAKQKVGLNEHSHDVQPAADTDAPV